MNYEQFVDAMLECTQKKVSDTELVEKQELLKNNGVVVRGISIRDQKENAAPVIYLEDYYRRYCKGEQLERLAEELLIRGREMPDVPVWNYHDILDFQKIKDKIVYKLINAEYNEQLLSEVPNLPLLDFAIVFYVMIPGKVTDHCSILVRNTHMDHWKLSLSVLYQCAKENTPRLYPHMFRPLSEFVGACFGEDVGECPLYVLSNQRGINGAAVILYSDILKGIYQMLGCSYHLLPSSIHEFLILPEDGVYSAEELKRIVQEVNREHLAREEFLSDHIYHFSGDIITKV